MQREGPAEGPRGQEDPEGAQGGGDLAEERGRRPARRKPKRKKRRRAGLLLVGLVGAGLALALSEGLRKKVLDALFGPRRSSSTPRPPRPDSGRASSADEGRRLALSPTSGSCERRPPGRLSSFLAGRPARLRRYGGLAVDSTAQARRREGAAHRRRDARERRHPRRRRLHVRRRGPRGRRLPRAAALLLRLQGAAAGRGGPPRLRRAHRRARGRAWRRPPTRRRDRRDAGRSAGGLRRGRARHARPWSTRCSAPRTTARRSAPRWPSSTARWRSHLADALRAEGAARAWSRSTPTPSPWPR